MSNTQVNKIKTIRAALGLTQEEFGRQLGLDSLNCKVTVSNWENGRRQPNRAYAQIAKAFNISLDWLLNGTGDMFDLPANTNKNIEIQPLISGSSLSISQAVFPRTVTNNNCLKYIYSQTDSMQPTILRGDLLVIDCSNVTIKLEGIYLINNVNNLLIRRASIINSNVVTFTADNQIHQPLQLDLRNTKIEGLVFWIGRKLLVE